LQLLLLLLLQQILANKRNKYPLSDLGMGAQIPLIYHIKLHTFQHSPHPNNEKEIQANHKPHSPRVRELLCSYLEQKKTPQSKALVAYLPLSWPRITK
jgi:hypothetical protein